MNFYLLVIASLWSAFGNFFQIENFTDKYETDEGKFICLLFLARIKRSTKFINFELLPIFFCACFRSLSLLLTLSLSHIRSAYMLWCMWFTSLFTHSFEILVVVLRFHQFVYTSAETAAYTMSVREIRIETRKLQNFNGLCTRTRIV